MASVAQPPAPLGDDPFGGAFDAAFPGETKEEDMPHGLIEEFKAQAGHRIDVLGDMAASLNIKFNDRAARKPIGNLLNERVEEGAAVRSIGWHAIRVHEYEEVPDGEREHVGMRNYKDEDGARILLEKAKYLVVAPDRPPGFKGRIYVRNDGVWRVRDVMTIVLDTERYARLQTEWFGGVDAHHVMLDEVECRNGIVSYWFGS